jgi:hypothetical protein
MTAGFAFIHYIYIRLYIYILILLLLLFIIIVILLVLLNRDLSLHIFTRDGMINQLITGHCLRGLGCQQMKSNVGTQLSCGIAMWLCGS